VIGNILYGVPQATNAFTTMAPLVQEPFTLLTRISPELENINLKAAFSEELVQSKKQAFARQKTTQLFSVF